MKPFWNIHFAFHIVHRLFFKYSWLTFQYCSTQCINPLLNHVVVQIFHQISLPSWLQLSINENKKLSGQIIYRPLLYHIVPHISMCSIELSVFLFFADPDFWSEYLSVPKWFIKTSSTSNWLHTCYMLLHTSPLFADVLTEL